MENINVWKIGFGVFAALIWFGLIGPWMVSADNDLPVVGWILLTVTGIVYAFHILKGKLK